MRLIIAGMSFLFLLSIGYVIFTFITHSPADIYIRANTNFIGFRLQSTPLTLPENPVKLDNLSFFTTNNNNTYTSTHRKLQDIFDKGIKCLTINSYEENHGFSDDLSDNSVKIPSTFEQILNSKPYSILFLTILGILHTYFLILSMIDLLRNMLGRKPK